MDINGLEGISVQQLADELRRGGRFVMFDYVISVLVVTFRRSSAIYYLRPGESALGKGFQYILLTFFLGWWGIPFGLIYTPIAIIRNLSGGRDVTKEIMNTALGLRIMAAQGQAPAEAAPEPVLPTQAPAPARVQPPAAPAQPAGPVCPKCGTPARPGATVCGKCGARLGEPPEEARTCTKCGAQVEDDWRVCPECGEKLVFECPECGGRVERDWKTCPFCEAALPAMEPEPEVEEEAEPVQEAPKDCPVCGEPVQPDWSVCPACATPLNLTCPGCGAGVQHDWKTCPFCETDLPPALPEKGPQASTPKGDTHAFPF
jgi:predicted amidophosphoribosyltransferase